MAALVINQGEDRKLKCSGSLLQKNAVLLAAHCFDDISKSDHSNYYILFGSNKPELGYEESRVEMKLTDGVVHLHPYYNKVEESAHHDLAIIKLKKNVPLSGSAVFPICVAKETKSLLDHRSFGDGVTSLGYGASSGSPVHLTTINQRTLGPETCTQKYLQSTFLATEVKDNQFSNA